MDKKQKKNLCRIVIAALLLVAVHFIPSGEKTRFLFYAIPYLVVGYDVLKKAFEGFLHRHPFDEYLLMSIATLGAFLI